MDVGGGDAADGALGGRLGEGVVAGESSGSPWSHSSTNAVAPEGVDETVELASCRRRPVGDEGGGHGAAAR